jgi:CelD/BcsL family acetyltransferase involved in cellulose biosynthesis
VATLADLSVPTLERVRDPESLRDEWSELAARSGNLFATPEWLLLWWKHFGGERELLLTAGRGGDGRLETILPFYVWRTRPLRIVRALGHGPGDELGPIGERGVAIPAFTRWLETERFDLLLAEQLPGGGWEECVPGARLLAHGGSPVMTFDGLTWDELLASKSRNFREQVGRRARALEREHDVRYRLVTGLDGLDESLDTLFHLHGLRWGPRSIIARTETFQRDFAAIAATRGWLRLWLLSLDGRPAAAWLGFRFAGAECYYQAGRDPAFDSRSVAFVLLAHTVRAALEDGAREYRFLRGDEPYKYRFANADAGLETIGIAGGAAGRAALAAAPLARRIRASLAAR